MLVIKKNTLILAGAAVVAVMVAVGTAFSYRTKETFAPNDYCVIVDAGHGGYDLCFNK